MSNSLTHYGILRKSGRYPWGSGLDEYGRSIAFYQLIDGMKADAKAQGIKLSDKEIADAIGLTVQEMTGDAKATFTVANLRDTRTVARETIVLEETSQVVKLRYNADGTVGMSPAAISEQTGIPEPTVRLRLKNADKYTQSTLTTTANVIRDEVDKHDIVDIGKGVEHHLGISDVRLRAAVSILKDQGYETHSLPVKNVGTKHSTNQLVVVKPGVTWGDARKMVDRIHTMGKWSEDHGMSFYGLHDPISINPNRLQVLYKEDKGHLSDGVVYVRPGKADLDMGKNHYAQVRIKVGDSHFIKGMAVYNDKLPPGVDLQFNTNKSKNDPKIKLEGKMGALKPLTDDKDNPFGSMIKRQIVKYDKDGKEKVTSALNLVNEEGDWDDWRKSLPSQMLAKQPHSLISSQLDETRVQVRQRLDEINRITNPVIRRDQLEKYAELIDSDAVDLRAAAMPKQQTRVIIPMPKMNKNEIYAPQFETGEKVVLIRYPHGGKFEIPEVTVNNNNLTAKRMLGQAKDAIGIHPTVAERLSGADFDGDTVVVIPNRSGKVKGYESLKPQARLVYDNNLKNFDPKQRYGGYDEKGGADGKGNFKLMTNTPREMGMITNLITDMSIQGAQPEHVVRAVKHSMVVIDAEKHKLNYKQSAIDNNIRQLIDMYQSNPNDPSDRKRGASTLLSQATAKTRVPQRQLRRARDGGPIDKETGAQVWEPTGKKVSKYDSKTGTYLDEKRLLEEDVKRLRLTDDAHTLVRDKADPVERLYADHANEMKALANATRLMASRIPNPPTTKRAKEVYKPELDKLVSDLKAAEAQKPLNRRADVVAGANFKAVLQADPVLRTDKDRKKKVERQLKKAARARLGLEQPIIDISDRQWDAIQAGAVSPSRLMKILEYADPKRVVELSMPRTNTVMSNPVNARATAMLNAGASPGDVALALGISPSTLNAAIKRGDVG